MDPVLLNNTLGTITSRLDHLTQSVQNLQLKTIDLQNQLLTLQNQTHHTPFIMEPQMVLPEKFSGERSQYRTFINECNLLFCLKPRTYNSDQVKVRTIISLLNGEPAKWAHQLLETDNPILNSLENFIQEMSQIYDDTVYTAETDIRGKTQGRSHVEDYIVSFRRWSGDTSCNETALKNLFYLGLSEYLREEFARTGIPVRLTELMDMAIKLDRRHKELNIENNSSPMPLLRSPAVEPVKSEAMDDAVISSPLREDEEKRQPCCLYCTGPDHMLENCPLAKWNKSDITMGSNTIEELKNLMDSSDSASDEKTDVKLAPEINCIRKNNQRTRKRFVINKGQEYPFSVKAEETDPDLYIKTVYTSHSGEESDLCKEENLSSGHIYTINQQTEYRLPIKEEIASCRSLCVEPFSEPEFHTVKAESTAETLCPSTDNVVSASSEEHLEDNYGKASKSDLASLVIKEESDSWDEGAYSDTCTTTDTNTKTEYIPSNHSKKRDTCEKSFCSTDIDTPERNTQTDSMNFKGPISSGEGRFEGSEMNYTSFVIKDECSSGEEENDYDTDLYTSSDHTQPDYSSVHIKEESTGDEGNLTDTDSYTYPEHNQTESTSAELKNESTSIKDVISQKSHNTERMHNCSECGRGFTHKSDLVIHQRRHTGEKPFPCSICGKCFATKSDCTGHQIVHREERPFVCSYCGKSFKTRSHVVTHQRIHTGEKPFSCSVCGKYFSQSSYLMSHRKTHTGERPFPCTVCGKRFTKKSSLVTHQRIHTGEKPFSCTMCGKCFTDKTGLIYHEKVHVGEKPFSCSVCGKSFTDRTGLVYHERIHTGEKPFSCSECGKAFICKSGLVSHQRIHTGEKPFTCLECGKCFNKKGNLVKHRLLHTGENPFSCSLCGKGFSVKSKLVRHEKIHTGEKPYSCTECGKSFTGKASLIYHQKIHTEDNAWSCSECGQHFSQKSDLLSHKKDHKAEKSV
ncbi:zinc finger protein 17-like [Pelobates fuscus]|uniref:zinc finger protein 17-like n=1 Tax=Pelobates fuscus TaxID=191477 RepID=UPI002FE49AAC